MGAPFKFKTMDNLDNNTCLYLHIKPESKEVFYVGIGNSRRPYEKGKKRSEFWNRVVNKYGYEVIILADNLSWNDACEKEIYLIDYFGRRNLGKGTLVNMTDGGDGTKGQIVSSATRAKISEAHKGRQFSEETKRKMSEAAKGRKMSDEARAKISTALKGVNNPRYGKKLSEETKAKIGAFNKGKKHNAETRAKIAAAHKGENNVNSKLIDVKVIEILIELRDNPPYYGQLTEIGKKYGVTKMTIGDIKQNRSWKHICRETLTIR